MTPSRGSTQGSVARARRIGKRELRKFAALLEEEKAHLVEKLGHLENSVIGRSIRDASGDLSGYSIHMADVGTDAQERETALQYATEEGRRLYDVLDALRKIETGEYGICEECEKPIDRVRLEALPHARLCLTCQEKKDRLFA